MTVQAIIIRLPIDEEQFQWAGKQFPEHHRLYPSQKRTYTYLLGRSLLTHALTIFYDITVMPELNQESHGKPILEYHPDIHFNISHCDQMLVVILGNTANLGIDVETIKTRKNFSLLEERVFTNQERQWIHQQSDYERAFFLLWSAKEAYLKADGRGLSGLELLALDMNQKKVTGPLKQGKLSLTLLERESFAVYTPQPITLSQYACNKGILTPIPLIWDIELTS